MEIETEKGRNRGPEALSMVKILAQKAPFLLSVALPLNYSAPPFRTFAQYRASIGPNGVPPATLRKILKRGQV